MVRHTVQNMARERADIVIPDYTATLGQMADQLAQVSKTLTAIGNKPAIELTPEDIAVQIKRASLDMLRDSQRPVPAGPQRPGQCNRSARCNCRACPHRGRAEAPDLALCRRGVGCRYPAMVDPARHHRSRHARKLALARTDGSQSGWRTDYRGSGHSVDPVAEPGSVGGTGGGATIVSANREALERCNERADTKETSVSCSIAILP